MNKSIRSLFLAFSVFAFGACTTTKVALTPDTKQSIKRIAIIQTPEPDQYILDPGQSPGGSFFYLFGAIGGAFIGSVEASRIEAATKKFTSAVAPYKPNLSNILLTRLEKGLLEKGYHVQTVPPPPTKENGKEYDYTKVNGMYDAILNFTINAGYSVESNGVEPNLRVYITLISSDGQKIMFADTYVYRTNKLLQFIQVIPDPKYIVKSQDDLYANVDLAVEGMRVGADKLAERVVVDF